jgi:hypothetical protein
MGSAAGREIVPFNFNHPDHIFYLGRELSEGERRYIFRWAEVNNYRMIFLNGISHSVFQGD